MNDRDRQEESNPIIMLDEKKKGKKFSRAVGRKGVGYDGEMDWFVKDSCEEPRAWRHPGAPWNRIILKSDGEPAIQSLKTAIGRFHGCVVILEVFSRGQSQSNGAVEQAAEVVLKEQVAQKAQSNWGRHIQHHCGCSDGQPCFAPSTWWEATAGQHMRDDEIEGDEFQ